LSNQRSRCGDQIFVLPGNKRQRLVLLRQQAETSSLVSSAWKRSTTGLDT
jgi:hypothetical protein